MFRIGIPPLLILALVIYIACQINGTTYNKLRIGQGLDKNPIYLSIDDNRDDHVSIDRFIAQKNTLEKLGKKVTLSDLTFAYDATAREKNHPLKFRKIENIVAQIYMIKHGLENISKKEALDMLGTNLSPIREIFKVILSFLMFLLFQRYLFFNGKRYSEPGLIDEISHVEYGFQGLALMIGTSYLLFIPELTFLQEYLATKGIVSVIIGGSILGYLVKSIHSYDLKKKKLSGK